MELHYKIVELKMRRENLLVIKLAGITCVIVSTTILGWYLDKVQILRIEDLKGLCKILHMLYSEVDYSITPLPLALKEIINKNDTRVKVIFENLLQNIEQQTGEGLSVMWERAVIDQYSYTYLEQEDIKILISFGKTLGYLDKEMQKKNISITLKYIENQIIKLEKEQEKTGKIYKNLGMLGGCLLCILLF